MSDLEIEQPDNRRIGEKIAVIAAQQESHADDRSYEAANEEAHWDKRTATSNFGRRLSGKIQQAIRNS
jgi:hypothetical protein